MNPTGHIFISYARKDGLEHATRLEQALNAQGYATWRDIRKIDPAQDFTAEIEQGIEQAAWVVVCITPDVKRGDSFVRREIQYALVVKKPVLVARFGDVPPPIHVIDNTWIEFWRDWTAAEQQLLSNLRKEPIEAAAPKSDDPFRPYVERLLKTSVNFLQKTVITLIDVESTASPEAVEGKAPEVDMLAQLFEAHELKDETEAKSEFKTFAEAFEHYHGRVLLLGEPGAGKTITLMATTREAATRRLDDPTQPLPLFGLIATWDVYKQPPLMEWLVGAIPELKGSEAAKRLRDEDVLFLLDGLDELPESRPVDPQKPQGDKFNPRIRFLEVVERSTAKMIISCRIVDYKDIRRKAKLDGAVTLKRLTDEQINVYLRDLPLLWNVISADKDLLDTARTPLLLSIMAFAFQKQPENLQQLADLNDSELRDAIFSAYIRERYEHERRKLKLRGSTPSIEIEALFRYLGWIAMINVSESNDSYENLLIETDFWRVVGSTKSPALIAFGMQLNIILEAASSNKWRFAHISLRNSLAHRQLEKLISDSVGAVHLFLIKRINSSYSNRILFWNLIVSKNSMLSQQFSVWEQEKKFPLYMGETLRTLNVSRLSKIDKHIAIFGSPMTPISYSTYIRDAIAERREIEDAAMVDILLKLLTHPNYIVRYELVSRLAKIGDIRAVEGLILLLTDSDADIRYHAVMTLGYLGITQAINAILLLLTDTERIVRYGAITALGLIGHTRAVNHLLLLLTDNDSVVRSKAAFALGLIGDADSIYGMLPFLSHPNVAVSRNVIEILWNFGNEEALRIIDKFIVCE